MIPIKKDYEGQELKVEMDNGIRIFIEKAKDGPFRFLIKTENLSLLEIIKMPWPFDINKAYLEYNREKNIETTISITGRDFYPDLEREFCLKRKEDILNRLDPGFWKLYKQLFEYFKTSTEVKLKFNIQDVFRYSFKPMILLRVLGEDHTIEKVTCKPIIVIKRPYKIAASSKMEFKNAVKAINRVKIQMINRKLGR